jgi:nicotinate-nucleotide adenylyltransferase
VKLGLYGGSFDPIHLGHLLPVRHAMETLGLDRVLYVPTARPPHKRDRELAPAWSRFTMVELSLLDEPRMWASPLEMEAGGVAYTVDTLQTLRREQPEVELYLLLGSDSFSGLLGWHQWQKLSELAMLAVMARPGWQVAALAPELAQLVSNGGAQMVPQAVQVDASSSEIRRRIADDEVDLDHLMPKLVLDYITKYELYR